MITLFLALAAGLLLFSGATASAASPIAKDGRINACYKAKGKGKGTMRLLPSGKARCPRKWRKISWGAAPAAGPRGEAGAPGAAGSAPTVQGLEGKVSELQARVQSLEAVLKGVSNQDLLAGLRLAPTVQALCGQAGVLTNRLNVLEGVLGGLSLNGVLTTLGGLLDIPALPGALPAFSCPAP